MLSKKRGWPFSIDLVLVGKMLAVRWSWVMWMMDSISVLPQAGIRAPEPYQYQWRSISLLYYYDLSILPKHISFLSEEGAKGQVEQLRRVCLANTLHHIQGSVINCLISERRKFSWQCKPSFWSRLLPTDFCINRDGRTLSLAFSPPSLFFDSLSDFPLCLVKL